MRSGVQLTNDHKSLESKCFPKNIPGVEDDVGYLP